MLSGCNKERLIKLLKFIFGVSSALSILVWQPLISSADIEPPMKLDDKIVYLARQYVVNEELAREIINCESAGKSDAVNVNTNGSRDYSYWQINDYYWKAPLAKRGWDITIPDQNLEAGFWILSNYGSSPWVWSAHCWSR